MKPAVYVLFFQAVAEVVVDVGDALTTTEGKWSVMHMAFGGVMQAVPFPDGTAGLDTAQKAMMLGLYSEHAY